LQQGECGIFKLRSWTLPVPKPQRPAEIDPSGISSVWGQFLSPAVRPMPRTKKPKVQIKRTKTSLGGAYRIYVDGEYVGAGLTLASARDAAKRRVAKHQHSLHVGRKPTGLARTPLVDD
jgi:hypothetical protein